MQSKKGCWKVTNKLENWLKNYKNCENLPGIVYLILLSSIENTVQFYAIYLTSTQYPSFHNDQLWASTREFDLIILPYLLYVFRVDRQTV